MAECSFRRLGRLRKTQFTLKSQVFLRVALTYEQLAGCSKRPDFSPAQPWRAETRLVPGKAAASEEARRYVPHFVGPFAHTNGSWRTDKPLQCFRLPKNSR